MTDSVQRLLQRWRTALAWRPSPELLALANRNGQHSYRHGWPGFRADPFPLQPVPTPRETDRLLAAYDDYDRLNRQHFAGELPPVKLCYNLRLRSIGGRINPAARLLELNWHRAIDLPDRVIEIIFHEQIHLWLYAQGLPSGHTPAFKAKMVERGHTSIYYGVDGDPKGPRHVYPGSDRRVIYRCNRCGSVYLRRSRYTRQMLCRRCLANGRRSRMVELGVERGHDPR